MGLYIPSYISRTNSFPGGSQEAETSFGPSSPFILVEQIHFQEALKRLKEALGLFIPSYISRTNSVPGSSQEAETSFGLYRVWVRSFGGFWGVLLLLLQFDFWIWRRAGFWLGWAGRFFFLLWNLILASWGRLAGFAFCFCRFGWAGLGWAAAGLGWAGLSSRTF